LRLRNRSSLSHSLIGYSIAVKLFQRTSLNYQCLRPLGGSISLIDQSNRQAKSPKFDGKGKPSGTCADDEALMIHSGPRHAGVD
jgi:hypothetical protein